MKKLLLFITITLTGFTSLLAQDFYLNTNGVTCMCPDAAVGDTGVVNGINYTKRTKEQITDANASTTCTSDITDMSELFYQRPNFNSNIASWDVSNVTDMYSMFRESAFNQDINSWDVSSVTDMSYMFYYATSLNQDISNWDVGNVTDMVNMFGHASAFNQPIGDWNVSGVANMYAMFYFTSAFNQPIGDWDVSSVTDMSYMFHTASAFNQPIGDWGVSGVTDMSWMFHNAGNFVQDISNWCVSNITSEPTGFSNGTQNFPESYKPVWGTCSSLGIDDRNLTNISISPNPTENTLFIIGNETPIAVSIYNVLGKEVLYIKNTNNINVQALPSGVYMIRISDGVSQTNRKFIKN